MAEAALLFSVFVIAACGLLYELAAGALASYLLGDSVLQFSTIIGTYLFAMGLGSYGSRFIERQLPAQFLRIQLLVGLVGGLMPAALFLAHSIAPGPFRIFLYGLGLLVGFFVGLEIPLVMRILKKRYDLKDLVSQVLTFDYLGALAVSVAFPLLLVPKLGLIRSGLMFGLLNAGVALWMLRLFKDDIRAPRRHAIAALATIAVLGAVWAGSNRLTTTLEEQFYSDRMVFAHTSEYQRVVVTQGKQGARLFLNGNLQFAERDEYRYHEALVHPAMSAHGAARRVAVLGGGDGMAVREILKYPGIESVTLVELDPSMTDLFSREPMLLKLNGSSLKDPRVRIINRDAYQWLENPSEKDEDPFDVIIVDFPDPSNFSLGKLYTHSFYTLLQRKLSASGYAVIQSTSPLIARNSFWTVVTTLESVGLTATPYHAHVPSFGEWGFIIASRRPWRKPAKLARRAEVSQFCKACLPCSISRSTWHVCPPRSTVCTIRFWYAHLNPNGARSCVDTSQLSQTWSWHGASGSLALSAMSGCDTRAAVTGGFVGPDPQRGHRIRTPELANASTRPVARTREARVVIVGAGIAGLGAAWALQQHGLTDFAILELEPVAGGNSRGHLIRGIACPMGAHYLPVPLPRTGASETITAGAKHMPGLQSLRVLLADLGLMHFNSGKWQVSAEGERHLCHSPQERLFFKGVWQEGLLPVNGIEPATLEAYKKFEALIEGLQKRGGFTLPAGTSADPGLLSGSQQAERLTLDSMTFAAWLDARQLTDPALRWYLDYCCRDDYGAGLDTVSAWAGVHYFASRHGFQAPHAGGGDAGHDSGVFTWPQGNGWISERLAARFQDRLHTDRLAVNVSLQGTSVRILALHGDSMEHWDCEHCILATPLFLSHRLLGQQGSATANFQSAYAGTWEALARINSQVEHASWVVANASLSGPLKDRGGAAPAWDNVIYGSQGLGYVDAQHQSVRQNSGSALLSYYLALGAGREPRKALLEKPWSAWPSFIAKDLKAAHPDFPTRLEHLDIARYGHAMAVPKPGWHKALSVQARSHLINTAGNVHFAHADLAGYSVFEEAFSLGVRAAENIAAR